MTGVEVRNEGIQSDYNAKATVDKKSYGDRLNILFEHPTSRGGGQGNDARIRDLP